MATVLYGDFEWDDAKAAANLAKHAVSFEEASTVFADPCYILLADESHPENFWAIGLSGLARVLTVVHVERGPRIRIISARHATRSEAQAYERRRF
jgi:uncharacterized DUF497 family protein